MKPNQRGLVVTAGVVAILVAIVTASMLRRPQPATSSAAASNSATRAQGGANVAAGRNAEAVKLEALKAPRPHPVESERNPFRFKPRTPPPRPTAGVARPPGQGSGSTPSTIPTVPPGPPPIVLKFIGILDAPTQGGKVAVLSDGRSVFYGHEGGVIDGRFRIVRIGVESVEMMYVDGRGRQTIRLSGQ